LENEVTARGHPSKRLLGAGLNCGAHLRKSAAKKLQAAKSAKDHEFLLRVASRPSWLKKHPRKSVAKTLDPPAASR